jgi:hypothetical protein
MIRSILGAALVALAAFVPAMARARETLYNGIELPDQWPPQIERFTHEPMRVPYLEHPPAVIPIDVGRQLLVDDFLIEQTTLRRTFHRAKYHPANPILKPDKPWERREDSMTQRAGLTRVAAMPFSDGVWYDPADKRFKMWYIGGYSTATCYAESNDGVHWVRPALDVVEPGTNIVYKAWRDSAIVWLDHHETDPKRRFKMFVSVCAERPKPTCFDLRFSPDGIHWSEPVAKSPPVDDGRCTFFFNPFRNVWVYSIRLNRPDRLRAYWEDADVVKGMGWSPKKQYVWTSADRLDPRTVTDPAQLYNLDATPYESLMLGLFSILQIDRKRPGPKRNEVLLGFSRDGFHWHRPDRVPFAGVSQKQTDWNFGNVQSAGGGCLIVGDKLHFYVSGRRQGLKPADEIDSTGLAILRRDGFASLDAGNQQGALTTRTVRFGGNRLFVNVDAPKGSLRAEILDQEGNVLAPFTKANCEPIAADKTLIEVRWKGAKDLSALAGKPVRFRFTLCNGSLYAFWVSPDASGASHGYVAAGGPGFTGPIDTVGQ